MPSFSDARALAEQMLADHLPARWERTQAVAREAIRVAGLDGVERDALIQAAVLADIGSSPVLARTGDPARDGARFLSARGYDARVVGLVARRRDDTDPTADALRRCEAVADEDADPDARTEPPVS